MSRRSYLPALAVTLLLAFVSSLRAQIVTYTWISRSDDSDFEDSENWMGGVAPAPDTLNTHVVFGPATRGHVYFSDITAYQLKFDRISRWVELYGYETLNLGGGGIIYTPSGNVPSFLDSYVQLHASQTWNIQAGSLTLFDSISDEFFNGETWASANYNITKTGAGTLVMDNYGSGGWGGGMTLNEGRLGVTSYAGNYGGLGEGPLTINGGTLVALDPDDYEDLIYIANDIVINGTLTTENQTELQLGYSGDGESSITLATDVTIRSSGKPLFLTGHVGDNDQARKLTIDSDGAVIIGGPTSYSGGTEVTKGVLIFDRPALSSNIPATGSIKVGSLGYVGITSDDDTAGLIGKIDPASTGSIGFDTDPDSAPETFTNPIDLSGLNGNIRIGSATAAILGTLFDQEMVVVSSATITPFGNTYRFGGGGGFLEVQTPLVDAPGPVSRNVVLDSPAQLPLSVLFTSPDNDFTGGVSATHSGAVFGFGALPNTGTLTLGDGGYIGTMGFEDVGNPTQAFIDRFASTTDRGMIGFDSSSEHITITDSISLSGFGDASPGVYLGTHTAAHLDGAITPQGSIFRFGAYKGGQLTVNTQLTGAGNSVHIGDPTSLGTMGDFNEEEYSQVVLTGDNSYGGTTTLYTGELVVGQSNGVIGSDPTTALGTGALIVQPHMLTLPPGQEDVRPQLSGYYSNVVIANPLDLNSDLTVYGGESSMTLAGNISGAGELYTEGLLSLTLSGNNSAFSGGIYLSDYTYLTLANDTAAGTGPIGFGLGQNLQILFESAAPVLGGLHSSDEEYDGVAEDYGYLTATQPNTVLTINQVTDGLFNGEFRHDASDGLGALRLVKEGAGTLRLVEGGLYVYNGVPEPTLGNAEVTIQVNAGTLVVDGDFYTGETNSTIPELSIAPTTVWVNGGTLAVDNWGTIGNPLVLTSGKLAGEGHFNTATIGTNAVLSPGLPGTAIGQLDFRDLTLAALGTMEWNIRTADPLANDYDLVSISGPATLHLTAGTTADNPLTTGVNEDDRFTLKLISLMADGTPGTLTGLSGERSYTWTIFDATLSSIEGFDPDKFIIDASLFFTDLPISTLTLEQNGNLIQLTFQPVPEPSTYALFALGLGFIGFTVWRRRSRTA